MTISDFPVRQATFAEDNHAEQDRELKWIMADVTSSVYIYINIYKYYNTYNHIYIR